MALYGVLHITIVSAQNLINTDEYTGKSDPFVEIYLDGKKVGETTHKSNDLNPIFQEGLYITFYFK
jgi:Ca2+-dependent lipid-binding protein